MAMRHVQCLCVGGMCLLTIGLFSPNVIAAGEQDNPQSSVTSRQIGQTSNTVPDSRVYAGALQAPSRGDGEDEEDGSDPVMVSGGYAMRFLRADSRGKDTLPPHIPLGLQDPAFDKYVDLHLLGQACAAMDTALLTDVGLQLAEGERILLRPHKVFPADTILRVAVKAAAIKGDVASLDRLAKVAETSNNAALRSQVATARKLAAESRSEDPAMMVPVDEMSPEQFALYQQAIRDLQWLQICGDENAGDCLKQFLIQTDRLPAHRRDYLLKLTSERRATARQGAEGEAVFNALAKLRAISRDSDDETSSDDDDQSDWRKTGQDGVRG